ncbi:hypothetical protein NKG94_04525 [Micromonospora sp. M12]
MRRADAGTLVDAGTGTRLTWFELGFATFVNFFDATWADLATMLLALERGEVADPHSRPRWCRPTTTTT